MRKIFCVLSTFLALLSIGPLAFSQGPATGTYQFGSFDTPGIDTINRGNLNVHLSFPIVSKPGRGRDNFVYALNYDSTIWLPTSVTGSNIWVPQSGYGWRVNTTAGYGYVTYYESLTTKCTLPGGGQSYIAIFSGYKYHDMQGVAHSFGMFYRSPCGGGFPTGTGTYATSDNSGYVIYENNNGAVVTSPNGITYEVGSYASVDGGASSGGGGAVTVIDTNGNQISATAAGVFTDTTGKTALTITGSGTPSSPHVYTYTDSNGNPEHVTVNYTAYTVQTNFGVSGISEFSQTGVPLVNSIVYPDNSSYVFAYEPTPGNPSATTGRIASITLRTGGTISYVYSGGSNGIETDGSTAGLTRTTTDGTGTYTRSAFTTTSSTTQIQDPAGNNGIYTFLQNSAGYIYENSHSLYTGAASGTPVEQVTTCFSASSTCVNPSVSGVIGSITTTTTRNGTTVGTDLQTFTGPELLASDTGPTGIVTTYTYATFTDQYGIPFYRLNLKEVQSAGATIAETGYFYDETTPTPTSGLPQHVALSTPGGNLTSIHQLVLGITTATMTYDNAGQVLSATDGNGNVTSYGYDSTDTFMTKLTRPVTNGVNHISSAVYDINTGLMTSSTDENSQVTSYTYDGMERPTIINYPDGGKTTYSYTPTSTAQGVLENSTTTLTTTVDLGGMGRVIHVYYPNGSVVDTTHDPDGRVACVSNPHGSGSSPTDGNTCYTYDVLNRVLKTTNPDNSTKTSSYNGETITLTDENSHQRQMTVDGLGRIVEVLEPNATGTLSWETDYTWTGLNELYTVSQKGDGSSGPRVRTFNYDTMGRLTSQVTPEQGTTSFGYDNASNLTSRVDARNIRTTYTYDALNRITAKSSSDGSLSASYSYDNTTSGSKGIGRLFGAFGTVGTGEGYYYDSMGRVTGQSYLLPSSNGTWHQASNITYDLAGNVTSQSYPDGRLVSQTYTQGQLTNVTYTSFNGTSVGTSYLGSTSFAPPGELTNATYGNGVQMVAGFNNRLTLASLQYKTSAQTLWSKQYTWAGNAMNLTKVTDTLNSEQTYTYAYDPDNRLTSASATGVSETYTIDPWGNLKESGNFNFTQNFSTNNQVAATGYTYDAAGELTADGNGNTYTYDADGMITASSGATYTYDALDQRVAKTGGSNPTETIYFNGQAIALHNPSSGAWTDLIYAGSSMIAEVAGTQTALPMYRHVDHLGSLVVQTNNSGAVTGSNVFLPFGDLVSSTTSDVFQYTGLPQDTENSSFHATFRSLSTTQGRWLRPDPYNGSYDLTNPQSFNRYVYAMNNPLARPDPSGLDGDCGITCWGEDGGGTGGAGGGGGCGLTCAGNGGNGSDPGTAPINLGDGNNPPDIPIDTTNEPPPPTPGSCDGPCSSPQPPSPSPPPPLVPVVFTPSPGPPGQPSSGGGSSIIGSAPNNSSPNKNQRVAQCVAQVRANAQNARFYIEVGAGTSIANTTAACMLGGPGAPECAVIVDLVELANTGLILWGESNNESQEEAACRQ
jgi:RHS repeat-associated protein